MVRRWREDNKVIYMCKITKRYVDFSGNLVIESLSHCNNIINKLVDDWNIINNKSIWFRGQSNFAWELIPGLYRYKEGGYFEREINREFILHSQTLIASQPSTILGWLVLMQHFGMPTRLLDWTESYLVALFFAVMDCNETIDAAIWVIRPAYLNNASLNDHTIPIELDARLKDYILPWPDTRERDIKAINPAAFRPWWNNSRIVAQRGMFTIHGSSKEPLNRTIEQYNKMGLNMQAVKLLIPGRKKRKILQELRFTGTTDFLLFPEIDGLCREIASKYLK